jgi:hypothetical protein
LIAFTTSWAASPVATIGTVETAQPRQVTGTSQG